MKIKHIGVICTTLLIVSTLGCTSPNPYGNAYGSADAQIIQDVYYGTIVKTEPVTLNTSGGSNLIGTIAGAAIGGLLGSKVGGGTGADIAAIGGGLLGGYAGSAAASELGKSNGVNLTIKLDNSGETISIVQAANPNMMFEIGQQVQVNVDGKTARVVPR